MAEQRLKASIIIGGLMDGSLRSAMTGTQSGFRRIGDSISRARKDATRLNEEIKALESSGGSVERLKLKYDTLAKAIKRAEDAQKRLRSSEARSVRIGEIGSGLRSRAVGVGATGAALAASGVAPIRQAMASQVIDLKAQSIGLSEGDVKGALMYARRQNIFGVSKNEMAEMMTDLLGAFGERDTAEHALPTLARMKFAYTARYGQSAEDAERQAVTAGRVIDARGGARSTTIFDTQADYVNRAIQATGGKVTPEMLRQIQVHGGAAANAASNVGIYYHAASLANETQDASGVGTGMLSAYQSLYQGHTQARAARNLDRLGLIGDRSKVKYDKIGQAAQLNPGALLGADIFRRDQFEWVNTVLLPQLRKRGITSDKGITDAIASIVSNSNGAKTLQAFYLNRRQIERDEKNAQNAPTIGQAYQDSQNSAQGQQIGAKAKVHDLELGIGLQLLPIYTSALQKVNNALGKLNIFTERHPRLARNLALGVGAVTVGMLLAAPAMVVAGSALNAYSGFALLAARREAKLTTAMLENAAAVEAGAIATARSARGAGLLKTAWAPIGGIFRGLGVAIGALFSPIGVLGLVLGSAALLIYKYWQPISTFFQGVWKGIQEGLGPLGPSVTAAFSPIVSVVKSVWGWFTNLLQPVHLTKDGVEKATASGEAFGKIVGGAIKSVVGWLEKAVGYFSWIGEHGASIFNSVSSKASSIYGRLTGSGEATTDPQKSTVFKPPTEPRYGELPELPALSNDNHTIINRAGDTHHHTYQITQQPGESSDELADRIHRKQAASQRMRTPLYDGPD